MITTERPQVKISDIVEKYVDNEEEGVYGYGGKLNIRPAFQREFVYDEEKRNRVIVSVRHSLPLSTMYWGENDDGTYEVIDGQQRTISICRYAQGDFSVKDDNGNPKSFFNLTADERRQFLDYRLDVCVCKGSDADKLEWFKTINIASVQLKPQELRNAVYTGPWLAAAKKHFSKSNCPAWNKWSKYLTGEMNRQDYLETALKWIADRDNCTIEDYMSAHQHDTNCAPLWLYFNAALEWAQTMFPRYRNEMKGLPWGEFYNRYKDNAYDPDEMEKRVKLLRIDDDVTKKKGIYQYLLSGDEKYLSIRKFTVEMSIAAYERQGGICPMCGKHYELEEMQADHIDPWSKGGKTIASNCQMLCASCNRRKSDI